MPPGCAPRQQLCAGSGPEHTEVHIVNLKREGHNSAFKGNSLTQLHRMLQPIFQVHPIDTVADEHQTWVSLTGKFHVCCCCRRVSAPTAMPGLHKQALFGQHSPSLHSKFPHSPPSSRGLTAVPNRPVNTGVTQSLRPPPPTLPRYSRIILIHH